MLLSCDALFCRRSERQSALNRADDYRAIAAHPDRLPLHRDITEILLRSAAGWDGYDYGEGYLYQGMAAVGLTGLRDTDARVTVMDLKNRLAGKTVLEIGCNTGFLGLSVAGAAAHVTAFDINPYLIEIGNRVRQHLEIRNADFLATSFEDFTDGTLFDVVLALANHSTYDGKTRNTLADYFQKCARLLKPGGQLIFESHAPAYEGDKLDDVCGVIASCFDISSRDILNYGTRMDTGRSMLVATRRAV